MDNAQRHTSSPWKKDYWGIQFFNCFLAAHGNSHVADLELYQNRGEDVRDRGGR